MTPPVPDRRAWLVLFGCLEIAMGGLLLLFAPLVLLTLKMSTSLDLAGPKPDFRLGVVSAASCACIGVFLLWVGVGTVKIRRWAPTLMLSASWLWLVTGISGLVLQLVRPSMLPSELAAPEMQGLLPLVRIVVTIVSIFVNLVLPSVFVLFFRSASVRRTVEHYDAIPRWTDNCPGPVLSMVLTLVFLAATAVGGLAWNIVPFFGIVVQGFPAALVLVGCAAFLGWLAVGFYRLRWAAFWGILALTILGTASCVVTFLRVPAEELYRLAGFEEEQLEMLRQMGLGGSGYLITVTLLSGLTLVGYVVYLWKFFPRRARGVL